MRTKKHGGSSSVGARMSQGLKFGLCEASETRYRRPKPTHIHVTPHTHYGSVAGTADSDVRLVSRGTPRASISNAPLPAIIPTDLLDDICFRFLVNIPEVEKRDIIRTCFQIELAYWFYIDFYCLNGDENTKKCSEITLRDFMWNVINRCDFLSEHASYVDKVIEQWREYKYSVPTYGAILLDSSLNYVLLVQGYYSARNNWGFPKGKVNEKENPTDCAVREVLEEVGYDISSKLKHNRLIQKFINETMTCLYIIVDVAADFPFAPSTRNEIGKIQWFSVWNLPSDRNDHKSCEVLGLSPNNFYTVVPFVSDLQAYIFRQQNKRNKFKAKECGHLKLGLRSASAFDPVHPQQKIEQVPSVLNSLFPSAHFSTTNNPSGSVPSLLMDRSSPNSKFFKPVSELDSNPLSFTGDSFLQMLSGGASSSTLHASAAGRRPVARPVPTIPKPSVPILDRPVYEAVRKPYEKSIANDFTTKENSAVQSPKTSCSSSTPVRPKESSAQRRARRFRNRKSEKESLIEDVSSFVNSNSTTKEMLYSIEPCLVVQLCEAWQNFKFDYSRIAKAVGI